MTELFENFGSGGRVLFMLVAALSFYVTIYRPVYNLFFHPLRKFPGPRLWAASFIPWGLSWLSGYWHLKIMELHDTYGPVIRITPDELSYATPEAWDDIYGRHKSGQRNENAKPSWYANPNSHEIVGAPIKEHTRIRRLLATSFTNENLLRQQDIISTHVDLLIERLNSIAEGGMSEVNLFQWMAFCTFDIIGDLSFGEPFDCLRLSILHPWISWVFKNIKFLHTIILCQRLPMFTVLLPLLDTWMLYRASLHFKKILEGIVDKRLASNVDRPDFMQAMCSKKGGLSMSKEEIYANAGVLTLAGAETTSHTLSVTLYMISSRPYIGARLRKELQDTFRAESQIDMRSVANLSYLNAVIQETLRYHTPGPNSLWRETPKEGNFILGQRIPGKTVVGIPHRVLYRGKGYFVRPDEFAPERWLPGDEGKEFLHDRKDVFHPFQYGPRMCLAEHFAHIEMRYILSRLLWNFDLKVAKRSRNWLEGQKAWMMWEKPAMYAHLTPRKAN